MTSLSLIAAGLGTGLSLIVAIGAQNAYVLRQGILRRHVLAVVTVCAVADALLIVAGVAGVGVVVEKAPLVLDVVRWGGVAFLVGYAVLALRRALHPGQLVAGKPHDISRGRALGTVTALTLLNPHVYIDTVILLGSIANQHGSGRWVFAAGAIVGSFLWFYGLGYGARHLAPLFARPAAWRALDAIISAVMLTIAATLAFG